MRIGDRAQGVLGPSLATLYLPPTATPQEAKRAFRGLMRQLHPDAVGGSGSHAQLTAVLTAYEHLSRSGFLDGSEHRDGLSRNGGLVDLRA